MPMETSPSSGILAFVKQIFPMATAPSSAASAFPLLILVPILALMIYLFFAPRRVRFEIVPDGLRISGDFLYGRMIAASDLKLEEARAFNLANVPEYKPRL